ncbi:MAG: hypothetical protein JWQ87_2226 [Candidatus Sulfotelmatobacter sp.]|nr:hypothetical protein [Candidatus Sulfotelmatobacter sp.]
MMRLNLIRGGKFSVSGYAGQQVLCKPAFGTSCSVSVNLRTISEALDPKPLDSPRRAPVLHLALLERLLGKSPLRLVSERKFIHQGCWQETLECGHVVDAFQDFLWDEKSNLVLIEPTAKRRRCQKCKPAVAAILKTKKEITADQARAALIHAQKLKFGTLFDKLCFANGELRPGPTEAEFAAWCKRHTPEEICSATKPLNVSQLPTGVDTATATQASRRSAKSSLNTSSLSPISITPKDSRPEPTTRNGKSSTPSESRPDDIPHTKKPLAVSRDGDVPQKTCAYGADGGKLAGQKRTAITGTSWSTETKREARRTHTSELGQLGHNATPGEVPASPVIPSPKKPVQSVIRNKKEEAA